MLQMKFQVISEFPCKAHLIIFIEGRYSLNTRYMINDLELRSVSDMLI